MTRTFKHGLHILLIIMMLSGYNTTMTCQEAGDVISNNNIDLTLRDAIELAIRNSPDAMMAKHRFRNSYWQYVYYKASYKPQLMITGSPIQFQNQQKLIETVDGSYYSRYKQLYSDLRILLYQEIGFSGGHFSLFSDIGYTKNFFDGNSFVSASPINISITQPVFGYNAYKWEKKIEPLRYLEAKQQYVETLEDIAITTTTFFFNSLISQIDKEIQETNLSNHDTLLSIAKGRYKMGSIAENEVLNMELNYLTSLSQLEKANLDFENQIFHLKSYLRLPEDANIRLIPPTEIPDLIVDAKQAVEEANENRADIISYKRQLLEAEQMLDKAKKSRNSFDLSLTFGLDKTGNTFAEAYKKPQNKEVAMLSIRVPIMDWGKTRGQIKMSESAMELTKTTVEQSIIDFDREIYIKAKEFNIQKSQLTIAAKSDTVAQKRYDFTKSRYLIGTIDITELNSASTDKDVKQQGYYMALQNFWIKYFEIRKLTLFDFERQEKLSSNFDVLVK